MRANRAFGENIRNRAHSIAMEDLNRGENRNVSKTDWIGSSTHPFSRGLVWKRKTCESEVSSQFKGRKVASGCPEETQGISSNDVPIGNPLLTFVKRVMSPSCSGSGKDLGKVRDEVNRGEEISQFGSSALWVLNSMDSDDDLGSYHSSERRTPFDSTLEANLGVIVVSKRIPQKMVLKGRTGEIVNVTPMIMSMVRQECSNSIDAEEKFIIQSAETILGEKQAFPLTFGPYLLSPSSACEPNMGGLSGSENPLVVTETGCYSEKSLELLKVGVERTRHHGGHDCALQKVRSCFSLNHYKGQYHLLSNFHSSVLLDALDLCRDYVHEWPDGDYNFMQEHIQRNALENVTNEGTNQLVVAEENKDRVGNCCKVVPVVPLAIEDPNDFQVGRGVLGTMGEQDWSTLSKGEGYLEVLLLKGVNKRDEDCISEWVLQKVKEFDPFFGMSYEGFENEAFELFKAIESRRRKEVCVSNQASGGSKRLINELKKLESSVNYD